MKVGIAVLSVVAALVVIAALVIPGSDGRIGLSCLGIVIVLAWIIGFMLNKLTKEEPDGLIKKGKQEENKI